MTQRAKEYLKRTGITKKQAIKFLKSARDMCPSKNNKGFTSIATISCGGKNLAVFDAKKREDIESLLKELQG